MQITNVDFAVKTTPNSPLEVGRTGDEIRSAAGSVVIDRTMKESYDSDERLWGLACAVHYYCHGHAGTNSDVRDYFDILGVMVR